MTHDTYNTIRLRVVYLECRQCIASDELQDQWPSGPEVIKLLSCSTQLCMKFSLLINVKMTTIVGILTCMSGENNNLGLTEPKKRLNFLIFLYL